MFFRIKFQPWGLRGMFFKNLGLFKRRRSYANFLTCVKRLISRNAKVVNFGRETIKVKNKAADEKQLIRLSALRHLPSMHPDTNVK